ncbi:SoxR reducing system RseC family protein [bacterium]|nr:SoxR reducing system RseC family protein [bacterium]
MPTEEGIVVKIMPEGALVRVKKSGSCHCCPSAKLCGVGDGGEKDVLAENPVGAIQGQHVEIEVPDGLFLRASFIVYIFPVLGLIMGGLLGRLIVTRFGLSISQDTAAVTGGFACMLAVYILIKWKSGSSSCMRKYRPKIIKTM